LIEWLDWPIVESSCSSTLQRPQCTGQLTSFSVYENTHLDLIFLWTLFRTVLWLIWRINMFKNYHATFCLRYCTQKILSNSLKIAKSSYFEQLYKAKAIWLNKDIVQPVPNKTRHPDKWPKMDTFQNWLVRKSRRTHRWTILIW
jgi:hypothetical protein